MNDEPNIQSEKSHAELIASLRELGEDCPKSDLADGVMAEIRGERILGEMPSASTPFFARSVMTKIEGRSQSRKERRWAMVSHGGVAVAAVLLVLLILPVFDSQSSNTIPEPETESGVNTVASNSLSDDIQARVREIRFIDGVSSVVLDAGLVEGVAKGDVFFLNTDNGTIDLKVAGVATWYCFASIPPKSRDAIRVGAIAAPLKVTPLMRESAQAIEADRPPKGAFFGLGVRVEESSQGVVIREVIEDIWIPDQNGVQPSRAARLGLRVGDRIVGVLGQPVDSEDSLERALAQITVRDFGLSVSVEREGKLLSMRESR